MKVLLFFTLVGALAPAWAGTQNHKAHVHGAGKLTIASDTPTALSVSLDIPGDSIFGFEHAPRTDAEKATQKKAFADLRNNADSVVMLDPSLGCHAQATRVEIEAGGGPHQDVNADYKIECSKPVNGSKIQIGLFKLFPKIHTLDVEILTDAGQSQAKVHHAEERIDL